MRFFDRVKSKYGVLAEDGPDAIKLSPGSSMPENWQSSLQTGYTAEEVREKTQRLREILEEAQAASLEAWDIWGVLSANGGKLLEMNSPLLIKGMSREKLLHMAMILEKCAEYAHIK